MAEAPEKNLALDIVRITEAAALASARWLGRGDKEAGDGAAVDAMRISFSTLHIDGMVVIGEGEKDNAPMLYNLSLIHICPLTLLLPARPGLPEPLLSAGGKAAVRVSPHPLATRLAHLAGGVLTASSANLSGRPPARTLEELDPELLSALAESGDAGGLLPALSEAEQPAGGEPSTLAEPLPEPLPESPAGEEGGCARLRLLRVGAVGVRALTDAGFLCL